MKTQYLSLEEWDAETYKKPHNIRTLRAWAKAGLIQPKPQKHGREYMVAQNAKYIAARKAVSYDPIVEDILNG